jgi:hypothetical protein
MAKQGDQYDKAAIEVQVIKNKDKITIGKHTLCVSYQDDDTLNEQKHNRITQSTYMLDPKELEKLTR